MATLRDIRRRITSVTSTQQITRAMKMVSAAKLNRAQSAVKAAQPYAERLLHLVSALHGGLAGEDHPLFTSREDGASEVILFTSDRGLCGGFNTNLCRYLVEILDEEGRVRSPELLIFGRRGNDFFKRRSYPIGKAHLNLSPAEYPDEIGAAIGETLQRYLDGELSRVFLAYNYFHNPIRQEPFFQQLLPIPPLESGEIPDEREMLFEPSRQEILDFLLPAFLRNQGLLAHLNTTAGEHGARMVAMEGATKNAGEMIDHLTLTFNRMRQAVITRELIEIVNGAQAL